jgi:hypothetical protein
MHRIGTAAAVMLAALSTAAWAAEPPVGAPVAEPPEPAATAEEAPKVEAPKVEYEILAEFVEEDSLSPLRYLADGLVTVNDRCPVRLVRLNRRMEPAYVNGRPVGFC